MLLAAGKTFRAGSLMMKSNVEMHLEAGATLQASPNAGDYPRQLSAGALTGGAVDENHPGEILFITAEHAENVAFTGLGVLLGVVASNSRATLLWAQLIFLPSMLISGLMMPFTMLPPAAQTVARLLPATYAMNAYSGLAYGAAVPFSATASVAILLVAGVLAFALAALLFNWDRQNRTARLHPATALLAALPYVAGMALL